jgi:hypothetical protein
MPRFDFKPPIFGDGKKENTFLPHEWFQRFEAYLKCFPQCHELLTLAGEPDVFTPAQRTATTTVLGQLFSCVSGAEFTLVYDCNTVKKAWDKLREV